MRSRPVALAALLVLVAVMATVMPVGLLMLSPALALVGAIWLGLFPGETLILRVRRRLRRRRAHAILRVTGRPMPRIRAARAGRTVAFALAMRPPPAAAASTI